MKGRRHRGLMAGSGRSWAALGFTMLVLMAVGAGAVRAQEIEPDSLRARAEVRDRVPPPAVVEDDFSRRAGLEVGAVVLTGVAHLGLASADAGPLLIPIAALGWGGYAWHRNRVEDEFPARLGLRADGLGPAFRGASLVALAATGVMAGIGASQGTLDLHRDMLPLMALYPAWGLLQQTLVQGFVAGNLSRGDAWTASPYAVVPISAAMFAAAHVPNWELTAATAALGLAFTPIYLEHENVWPLGLYHGVLGALFYFWVLDRNPWQETVGRQ